MIGGTLPLAGPAMYNALTPQWAGTLLGLLQVLLIPVPFVFYRYGEKIRGKSEIIRQLQEDQRKNAKRQSTRAGRKVADKNAKEPEMEQLTKVENGKVA
jgi:hypothetical protein